MEVFYIYRKQLIHLLVDSRKLIAERYSIHVVVQKAVVAHDLVIVVEVIA